MKLSNYFFDIQLIDVVKGNCNPQTLQVHLQKRSINLNIGLLTPLRSIIQLVSCHKAP